MSTSANVGTTDRVLRAAAGLVLVALPFVLDIALWTNPVVKWASVIVGLVLIATAAFRFCPLYRLIGASTCRTAMS